MFPTHPAAPLAQCNTFNRLVPPRCRPSIANCNLRGGPPGGLPRSKRREKCGGVLDGYFALTLYGNDIRHAIDPKRSKILAKRAIAAHIKAIAIASALPAQHRSARDFAVARSVPEIDQQALDPFGIALANGELDFLIRIFIVSHNRSARRDTPTRAVLVAAAFAFQCRFAPGRNASPTGGHVGDPVCGLTRCLSPRRGSCSGCASRPRSAPRPS
jgi:hypothetical protein